MNYKKFDLNKTENIYSQVNESLNSDYSAISDYIQLFRVRGVKSKFRIIEDNYLYMIYFYDKNELEDRENIHDISYIVDTKYSGLLSKSILYKYIYSMYKDDSEVEMYIQNGYMKDISDIFYNVDSLKSTAVSYDPKPYPNESLSQQNLYSNNDVKIEAGEYQYAA